MSTFQLIPKVVESLVMSVPDIQIARLVGSAKSDEGTDQAVCLFLTLQTRSMTSSQHILESVKRVLRSKLQPYECNVIHHVEIIEKFPLTTCGKIDRIALAQWVRRRYLPIDDEVRCKSDF